MFILFIYIYIYIYIEREREREIKPNMQKKERIVDDVIKNVNMHIWRDFFFFAHVQFEINPVPVGRSITYNCLRRLESNMPIKNKKLFDFLYLTYFC